MSHIPIYKQSHSQGEGILRGVVLGLVCGTGGNSTSESCGKREQRIVEGQWIIRKWENEFMMSRTIGVRGTYTQTGE